MNIKAHITVIKEGVDDIIESILSRRAGKDRDLFLNPPHPVDIPFSQLFKNKKTTADNLKKLFSLLEKCKKNDKTIIVYGDYDADGVTATAIMWETLDLSGFRTFPFIPHRKTHGYGLSEKSLLEIKKKYNPGLIITVDSGLSAHQEVSFAKKLGIPIVITDHHANTHKTLPKADVIFHAPSVSGSGLSYFVAFEISTHFGLDKDLKYEEINRDHLAMAAIGSIADMVEVTGITRSIVIHGIPQLTKTDRHGIKIIVNNIPFVTTFDIGYTIAPKINVFGRIDDPMDALRLICTRNYQRAVDLYTKAENLTTTRRQLVLDALAHYAKPTLNDAIVAVVSDDLDEGIIGLVSADCVKKFGKPAFIICKSGDFYKGSMRSTKNVDSAKLLSKLSEYTESSGGHAMAGGFVLKKENIDEFLKTANALVSSQKLVEEIMYEVDVILPLRLSSLELAKKIAPLSPFGRGNETPLFASVIKIEKVIAMGKTQKHARIKVLGSIENADFIYFNGYDLAKVYLGKEVTIVYQIEVDTWSGRELVSRKVVSIISD